MDTTQNSLPSHCTAQNVQLGDIMRMSRAELVSLWQDQTGATPPKSISQPLMRKILAFDTQLAASGGWPAGFAARLGRAEREMRPKAAIPDIGGRLLREWNGVTHVVEISKDGYPWNGAKWRSLSSIAREITGAHWSGPRFFGLGATAEKKGNKKLRAWR